MCKCEQCVNRAAFKEGWGKGGDWNDHALCYVWGIETCRDARGCDYWETNPKLARDPESTPNVPSVGAFGGVSKEKCNIHDYSNKDCKLKIRTAQVYGRWYNGIDFSINHGCMLGWGSWPCIYGNSFADERTAINEILKQLRKYVEGSAREEKDVIEYIKSLLAEQRQLTLF